MCGGTAQRNMTSAMIYLPGFWDVKSGKNIEWKATIGSASYGKPVVSNGKILLGTNNANPRNPGITGDTRSDRHCVAPCPEALDCSNPRHHETGASPREHRSSRNRAHFGRPSRHRKRRLEDHGARDSLPRKHRENDRSLSDRPCVLCPHSSLRSRVQTRDK